MHDSTKIACGCCDGLRNQFPILALLSTGRLEPIFEENSSEVSRYDFGTRNLEESVHEIAVQM